MSDEEYIDAYETSSGSDPDYDSSGSRIDYRTPPRNRRATRKSEIVLQDIQQLLAGDANGQVPAGQVGGISFELHRLLYGADGPTPAGDASGVTRLYRHECQTSSCRPRWSRFDNLEVEEADLNKRIADEPIVHRHTKKTGKWTTESFTIQCPIMRGVLKEALEKYQDLDMDLQDWTFKPPYRALVHRWDRLKEIQDGLTDEEKIKAAKTLVEFLTPVLAGSVESLSMTRKTGKVEFGNVWQIFPPGALAVTSLYGVQALCRVTRYEKVKLDPGYYWLITFEYVDWNGQTCGYSSTTKSIKPFEGFKHVCSLSAYALDFDRSAQEKKEAMLKRGRRFESLRGYHFLTCKENARKVVFNDLGEAKQKSVSGRLVIDGFAYFRTSNSTRPVLRSLTESGEKPDAGRADTKTKKKTKPSHPAAYSAAAHAAALHHATMRPGVPVPPRPLLPTYSGIPPAPPPPGGGPVLVPVPAKPRPDKPKLDGHELVGTSSEEARSRKEDLSPLTDEQCMLATPWLRGMDMKTKEWGMFFIDELHDIVWNERAFDNLVLPEEDKLLTWDFVEAKRLSNSTCDDFIADKGRGSIILMFGPPGVGKTFTAEAVAEKSHVPLYAVSAGVLGTAARDVEAALDQALDLCRLWGAILLLDEADVFLGARTHDGLLRNELVSIFLTKLEYYQGILFLTTNRIASIDHAFQSRIDLFLPYHDLDGNARRQVWRNFVGHLGDDKFEISEADFDRLAQIRLNGREIKNLIKSAQLLSVGTGKRVNVERLAMLAEKRVRALEMLAEHGCH